MIGFPGLIGVILDKKVLSSICINDGASAPRALGPQNIKNWGQKPKRPGIERFSIVYGTTEGTAVPRAVGPQKGKKQNAKRKTLPGYKVPPHFGRHYESASAPR